MEMGMQSVWVFGNETELLGRVGYPEVNGYLSYGGDVYGNETHAPEMVHFKDDAGPDAWSEEQKVRM
jgi:L-ascorbate oxidase